MYYLKNCCIFTVSAFYFVPMNESILAFSSSNPTRVPVVPTG